MNEKDLIKFAREALLGKENPLWGATMIPGTPREIETLEDVVVYAIKANEKAEVLREILIKALEKPVYKLGSSDRSWDD